MAEVTVVFADLTGSTGVFESLGNAKATHAITRLIHWIGKVCENHHGHVVKYLGDGVLILFDRSPDAVDAAIELQREHRERISKWPESLKMRLQIGMASGEIVRQDGDCYGNAVNVAARLSDLSGPEQILVSDQVIRQLPEDSMVRYRSMGYIPIRGRIEPCAVYRIEWQAEVLSEIFTVPASSLSLLNKPAQPSFIQLSWLDITAEFTPADLPMFLGRDPSVQFVISDRRVSRKHARIEWRAGRLYLEDISSYGTWVRFAKSPAIIALRRQECVLLQEGEMSLGASFEDFTVPTVSFKFQIKATNRAA